MELDDPNTPEFASWRSYQKFATSVRKSSRYVWGENVQAFLNTVLATLQERDIKVGNGKNLFRAQIGVDFDEDDGEHGFSGDRMKPTAAFAREGRANPLGIPVLYLATSEQTAISEVRPWIGQSVSVAQFKILRDVKLVDVSRGHGSSAFFAAGFSAILSGSEPSASKKAKAVWIDIDSAFSRPVTQEDGALDYIPTQILTELFKQNGYDGIVYRSQFGESGYNVVLFKLADAEPINCAPFQVNKIEIGFKETGNRWFKKKTT
jgi:hypothetical protein